MNGLWWGTLCLLLGVTLAATSEQEDLKKLKELVSATKTWKLLSPLSSGYIVRKNKPANNLGALGNFYSRKGDVRGVCPGLGKPTAAPTVLPSSLVKLVEKVEDMFEMLEKALRQKLCSFVHIAYDRVLNYPDVTYPIFAKLGGCKDPKMDAVYELGQVLVVPSSPRYSTKDKLCELAKLHKSSGNSKAVKTAMAIASGFFMPGPVVPRKAGQEAKSVAKTAQPSKTAVPKENGQSEAIPNIFGIGPVIPQAVEHLKDGVTQVPKAPSMKHFGFLQTAFDHVMSVRQQLHEQSPATAATQSPDLPLFEESPLQDVSLPDETELADDVVDVDSDSPSTSEEDDDDDDDNASERRHHKGSHHGPRHHSGHRGHRAMHIFFLVGISIFGVALVYILVLSFRTACRTRTARPTTRREDDAVSYCELVEEQEEEEEKPPRYSVVGIHLNAPIAV